MLETDTNILRNQLQSAKRVLGLVCSDENSSLDVSDVICALVRDQDLEALEFTFSENLWLLSWPQRDNCYEALFSLKDTQIVTSLYENVLMYDSRIDITELQTWCLHCLSMDWIDGFTALVALTTTDEDRQNLDALSTSSLSAKELPNEILKTAQILREITALTSDFAEILSNTELRHGILSGVLHETEDIELLLKASTAKTANAKYSKLV